MRVLFLLPTLTTLLAAAAPIAVDAPISRVRLHPDEAWVTRAGKVVLPGPGTHKLAFPALPPGLRIEDLQVSARGPAGTRIGDLAVASSLRTVTETAEWKRLETEREALRVKRDGIESQGEAAQQELTFLKGVQAAHDKEISARMAYGTPNATSIVEFGKSIQARMSELLSGERQRKRELEKLVREEARVDAEMKKRASERRTAPSLATLEITTSAAASVEVEVSYRSRAARWKPMYEARLSEDRKKLNLVLYAAITQTSSEPWEGVALEISNARPSRSLNVPVYSQGEEIGWEKEAPAPPPSAVPEAPPKPLQTQNYSLDQIEQLPRTRNASAGATSLAPGITEAPESTASVLDEASGLAATFQLEGFKDVPSDGEPHRFRVRAREIDPEMTVFATPRLEATAFLVARFPVPGGLPLFPNAPVVRFAGNQRLGEAPMNLPPAGQPFSLGFGPLKSMRVAYRRVDAKLEQVGTFSKDRLWTLRERLELSNDGSEELAVEVQDRILKSTSDQVKITLLPDFTQGWTETLPGVRAWKLKVPAKGEIQIQMPITIRAPKDGLVTGLSDDLELPAKE